MKTILMLMGWFLLFPSSVMATGDIPRITPEMEDAEFWIARVENPDEPILSPYAIKAFNEKFLSTEKTAVDPLSLDEKVSPAFFLLALEEEELSLLKKGLFDAKGKKVGRAYFDRLRKKSNLSDIPEYIAVRFGLVIAESSLRTFPTLEPVVEERGNLAFDLLQQSVLHPGTPVAVLWKSRDHEWFYVVSSQLRGWVFHEDLAFFKDKNALKAYQDWPLLVVTEDRVPFFDVHPTGKARVGIWRMGTILHTEVLKETGNTFHLKRPSRDASGMLLFVPTDVPQKGVQKGFLPLTPRAILTQAFKLLDTRYGWGGLRGGRDCSSFLRDVFLTMGVYLPRNSGPQSHVGKRLAHFEEGKETQRKNAVLDQSLPAATFVKLDNHIMLYLGKVEGNHYVIHATAGYRKGGGWRIRDSVVPVSRVIVSDMHLGRGSRRGSLLERMISLNLPFADLSR